MPGGEASTRERVVLVGAALVLTGAFAVLGSATDLHRRIPFFLVWYGTAFAAYLAAVRVALRASGSNRPLVVIMLVTAVAARLLVLPARPDLSTDIYRYLWEGRVVLQGVNPFAVAPADTALAPLRDSDFNLINHRHLATIYPPLAQAVFALAAWVTPRVHTLKTIFTVFDLATIGVLVVMLRSRCRPAIAALVYAWSPLVILETAHSGHLDAAGCFLFVAGVALFERRSRIAGYVAIGASILLKYTGMVLLPFLAVRRRWAGIAIVVVIVFAGYVPFFGAGRELVASLRTYGTTWWFNGPPFMALSGVVRDPDLARRLLTAFGAAFALVTALRCRDLTRYAYLVIACALAIAPTVYPWYAVWIVPFLCLFPNRAWIVFTGLVSLSYWVWIVYDKSGAWMVPTWVLVAEYVPFYALLAWDARVFGTRGETDG
jgi:Glycosyltransferase family 87